MSNIIIPNATRPDHLADVIAAMREMGAPRVHAVWAGEMWVALEGSHRIAAAAALGLTPEIIPVEYGNTYVDDIDPDHVDGWTVEEFVDRSWRNPTIIGFADLDDGDM